MKSPRAPTKIDVDDDADGHVDDGFVESREERDEDEEKVIGSRIATSTRFQWN